MSEDSGASRAEVPEAGEVAISIESFQHSQKNVHFYTGLPDYVAFEDLYWRLADDTVTHFQLSYLTATSCSCSSYVRCWLGLPERDLAFRFCVSSNTVSNICLTWANFVYGHLHHLCSGHCACGRGAPLLHSSRKFVSDCDHCPTNCRSEPQELSDTGKVVTSHSTHSTTIFVCPPMDMESTRQIAQAYNCQEGPPSYVDSCKTGETHVAVQDILHEVGLPPNVSRLLGQHGSGSGLTADDIVSLCGDIEHVIPK
ncbi:hypothetical protein HPB49_008796 [Dermacentor silvarum]|uniref:Uncharacterized protein n=1 Tax=Dermacentor silvarum TaxID=543639 RepID=A0ACB8DXK5_DERSI|nr:hypothetical protein HPB49_008796 [Dermacentor silvarum]